MSPIRVTSRCASERICPTKRAADDALQGRFQLVGNIGGEFAAVLLGLLLLGDVEGQNDRAAGLDARQVELVDARVAVHPEGAVPAAHGLLDRRAHLNTALNGQEILPDAGRIRVEQLLRRRVDAQDRPAVVQQHQPLLHAAGDLGKLVGPALQLAELAVDLVALAVDAAQKRRQLLIGIVVQRVLQIKVVQRLDDVL